ncbi:hypothetical protein SRABI70_03798 [Pseudomonas sp. Bi70]|nr:hypothetical protein SRABI70_03798 [Pseudomonas sp. Bi70]
MAAVGQSGEAVLGGEGFQGAVGGGQGLVGGLQLDRHGRLPPQRPEHQQAHDADPQHRGQGEAPHRPGALTPGGQRLLFRRGHGYQHRVLEAGVEAIDPPHAVDDGRKGDGPSGRALIDGLQHRALGNIGQVGLRIALRAGEDGAVALGQHHDALLAQRQRAIERAEPLDAERGQGNALEGAVIIVDALGQRDDPLPGGLAPYRLADVQLAAAALLVMLEVQAVGIVQPLSASIGSQEVLPAGIGHIQAIQFTELAYLGFGHLIQLAEAGIAVATGAVHGDQRGEQGIGDPNGRFGLAVQRCGQGLHGLGVLGHGLGLVPTHVQGGRQQQHATDENHRGDQQATWIAGARGQVELPPTGIIHLWLPLLATAPFNHPGCPGCRSTVPLLGPARTAYAQIRAARSPPRG